MMRRDWTGVGSVVFMACTLALAGCAETQPTSELVRARSAYDAARSGPAKTLEQDRLLAAKQALDRAESEHADDPGSQEERHLAYIATRAAEMAGVYGRIAANERDMKLAARDFRAMHAEMRKRADFQLATTDQTERDFDGEARQRIARVLHAELQVKGQARLRETEQGLTVTFDNTNLFAADGVELLSEAKDRLFQVAMALRSLGSDQVVTVVGYTDSSGEDTYNQRLSTARAESVRLFLISQGVPPDRIRAIGEGEMNPIGDNQTAEGRAANRRIEISIPVPARRSAPEPTSRR
jgi:outer membrane protein OmpA-like peptidoglycan-associated protein